MAEEACVLAFAIDDVPQAWDVLSGLGVPYPEHRREKASLLNPDDARRSLLSWALLRYALLKAAETGAFRDHASASELSWLAGPEASLVREPSGKPRFDGAPWLDFSLSHAGTALMCALSDAPVGCDAEMVDRFARWRPGFARRALRSDERAFVVSLSQEPAALASCALWTLKEAFGKREGSGISCGLSTIGFSDSLESSGFLSSGDAEFFAHGLHFRVKARNGAVFSSCSGAALPKTLFPELREIAEVVS